MQKLTSALKHGVLNLKQDLLKLIVHSHTEAYFCEKQRKADYIYSFTLQAYNVTLHNIIHNITYIYTYATIPPSVKTWTIKVNRVHVYTAIV